jgi:hypothetical protein
MKLPIEVKERTEDDYRQMLLQPRTPTQFFMLRIPTLPVVSVRMEAVGETALIGHWLRGSPFPAALETITICLGGLSEKDDENALTLVQARMLKGAENRSQFVEYMALLMEQVRRQPRPLGGHIHFDEESYDNTALFVCSNCLAVAFFDLYGVDGIARSTSEARSR